MEQSPILKPLTSGQVFLLAAASGVSVANIYYNQPVLNDIAHTFKISQQDAGWVSMLSQIGYGIGLFFLIPLGDKLSRKKLVLTLFALLSLALVGIYFAGCIQLMYVLSFLTGFLSVSPQIIIPMAATLNQQTRGKTVGSILSGMLIGILAARVLSGFIAAVFGWQMVFIFSAILGILVTILLYFKMPDLPGSFKGNYGSLLKSTLLQITRFAELREAALLGAMMFGIFTAFWTTLTFHLGQKPFEYTQKTIGMFGLVAICGALMAPIVGKLNDKGKTRMSLIVNAFLTLISVLLFKFFSESLAALIIGVVLIDIGVQGVQVTNAARIYGLDLSSGSRINTIYMTSYFLGGALGTTIGLWSWHLGGWSAVTMQMLIYAIICLLIIFIGGKIILRSNSKQNVN